MNVAVMKTKAEQTFCETFDQVADQLPGNENVRVERREAIGKFQALGLPHRRIEEWKYTDLRNAMSEAQAPAIADREDLTIADVIVALGPLGGLDAYRATFVNGAYRPDLSTTEPLDGVVVSPLSKNIASDGQTLTGEAAKQTAPEEEAVIALNTAYATDGAAVAIAAGAELSKPLVIAHIRSGSRAGFVAVRNIIDVGASAKATIVEAYVTLPGAANGGQENMATEIVVGDGSEVAHIKCTAQTGTETHLASWMVALGADANYAGFQLTQNVALARNQTFVKFNGENTKFDLSGAFLGRGREHIDTTLVVDHVVPHCDSKELFKGVLEDQARGVFQGKVIVRAEAQKTDGKQMAQAMLLSPDAEFDSKPELEIYADDVVCGHGSTSAEIDSDLLFYCQSRGIPEDEARTLLLQSFIAEPIDQVAHEGVREALHEFALQWLKA